jgi:signal transduction histidine kinase
MTHILILEDSPTQAERLRFILEEEGFAVTHAPDGNAGLAIYAENTFDVVISDIMMPGMSGYDFCRAVKKTDKGRATPVVLLSTLADPMDIIRGLECGADNFITKPYEPEQLMNRIRTVLQNREVRGSGKVTFGIEVVFLGKTFLVNSEKEQILDLLIATFEDIVRTNRGLQESKALLTAAKQEIELYAQELERRVKERTDELMEQQTQLHQAQKMEAVGQLTGGLAHDFNNLLTIVIGNLDTLESELDGNLAAQRSARDALNASLRGAELTRQLLAFSRRQQLQAEAVDLNRLVGGIVEMLRRTLGENIEIKPVLSDDLWMAEADPSQIESALVNLAVNARDAMPDGGQLTIETANKRLDEQYAAHNPEVKPGDYLLLAVSDSGTGIPPDVLSRVFDPFFTTKPVGKGTGLGLSMVYGFAKQSGGHAKIYSEVGHGTTVRLYLPRAKRDTESASPAVVTDQNQLFAKGEVVLAVEDNDEVRAVVVRHLGELGYKILVATNAAEAVNIVDGPEHIDLLFTDIVMPGKVTCQELVNRAQRARPDLRVLLTSGFSEAAVQAAEVNGVRHPVLSKPYRKKELAFSLRNVLDKGRRADAKQP